MPGAELTEVVDDRTWKGKVHVKFGPVQMAFSGTVVMEERDDVAHRAKLSAKGTEQRGKGVANAKVESWLEPAGDDGHDGPHPLGHHDHRRRRADVTRPAAGGLEAPHQAVRRVSGIEAERGDAAGAHGRCRPARDERRSDGRTGARERLAKPVGGFGLGLRALWATIVRFFSRLFGRRDRVVISGIVLAAGSGTRFGGTKQLASHRGQTARPARRRCARLGRGRRARRGHRPRRRCGRASAPAASAGPLRPESRSRVRPVLVVGRRPPRARRRHRGRRGPARRPARRHRCRGSRADRRVRAFAEPDRADRLRGRSRARRCSRARSTRRPDTCTATSAPERSSPHIPTGSRRSRSPSARLPTSTDRRISRRCDQLAPRADHRPVAGRLEAERRVEGVRVARVEEPGTSRCVGMLDGLPHQLHAEAVASMPLEHEHVAEPRHARAVRDHAREPDLLDRRGRRRSPSSTPGRDVRSWPDRGRGPSTPPRTGTGSTMSTSTRPRSSSTS